MVIDNCTPCKCHSKGASSPYAHLASCPYSSNYEEYIKTMLPHHCKMLISQWHKELKEALPHNPIASAVLQKCADELEKYLPK